MDWKFRDLFDARFRELFVKRFGKGLFRLSRILVIFVIFSIFFQFAMVPSESMEPTLQVNDYLLVQSRGVQYHRGNIITFYFPLNPKETYVKRIIGLPGDTVQVKNGFVYVNGKPLTEPYIMEKPSYTYPKTVVPKGCYFVLGDNRNNSYDSHYWGFVKRSAIRGKVIAILLPFQHFRIIHYAHLSG